MHQKGGVEGEIGRFRRRHLTPVPHVGSLAALNKALAAADARDDTATPDRRPDRDRRGRPPPAQLPVGCPGGLRSGGMQEDIGGVFVLVVRPVLGFKPKIMLIGPLDSAVPVELGDDPLATLRESLSNVVRNAEGDAGEVLVGVDMTAKTLTIRVEDNGMGIDPHVTPGGRNTAARARASGEHTTVVRRSEPGTTFTWVALPLEGKWELITDAAGGKPCSLRPLSSGRRPRGVRTVVRTRWTAGP